MPLAQKQLMFKNTFTKVFSVTLRLCGKGSGSFAPLKDDSERGLTTILISYSNPKCYLAG